MDREIGLGLDDWRITKTLFTWYGENNTESVRYKMKKKHNATIPKTTGLCPLLWRFFNQEITSNLKVKEIIKIITNTNCSYA